MAKKKRKNKLNCCEMCQNYWTCEKKWYRGERGLENICCEECNFYSECLEEKPLLSRPGK
jgi:hypothetical protein